MTYEVELTTDFCSIIIVMVSEWAINRAFILVLKLAPDRMTTSIASDGKRLYVIYRRMSLGLGDEGMRNKHGQEGG